MLSLPGGLVCRGVLEKYGHNVHTFISLSSPQAGQFGGNIAAAILHTHIYMYLIIIPLHIDTDYLNFLFPTFTRDNIYL